LNRNLAANVTGTAALAYILAVTSSSVTTIETASSQQVLAVAQTLGATTPNGFGITAGANNSQAIMLSNSLSTNSSTQANGSPSGQKVLLHELGHAIQYQSGSTKSNDEAMPTALGDSFGN
jgi:hypothetical protein